MAEPKPLEVNVNYSGGGKVVIIDYGKIGENYSASVSERWSVPEDWTAEQVRAFEVETFNGIKDTVAPLLQQEFDTIWANPARDWSP